MPAPDTNPVVAKVRAYAKAHLACETVAICAQLESDVADLSPEEARDYLKELGVKESGVSLLIRPPTRCWGCAPFSPSTNRKSGPGPFRRA